VPLHVIYADSVPNQLHVNLAQRILLHISLSRLRPGHHLTESSLQSIFGTSHGPIRAALAVLMEKGFVRKEPNKGYFLKRPPGERADLVELFPKAKTDRIYLQIASDRLSNKLDAVVTEAELMRAYGIQRHGLQRILSRIALEGWIERRTGHGWAFLPIIDSVEAYRESYELRRVLEPAGIRSITFHLDALVSVRLRNEQDFVYRKGYRTLGQIELFEANAKFHESIAVMSGNRFLAQTIARQNELRRLVEYRQTLNRSRVRRQSGEHLGILDRLESNDLKAAATLMVLHLEGAAREKARESIFRSVATPRH
jgi:DNA-binding GntR family transcriptional regulator